VTAVGSNVSKRKIREEVKRGIWQEETVAAKGKHDNWFCSILHPPSPVKEITLICTIEDGILELGMMSTNCLGFKKNQITSIQSYCK
jgi:hypothetical protein